MRRFGEAAARVCVGACGMGFFLSFLVLFGPPSEVTSGLSRGRVVLFSAPRMGPICAVCWVHPRVVRRLRQQTGEPNPSNPEGWQAVPWAAHVARACFSVTRAALDA